MIGVEDLEMNLDRLSIIDVENILRVDFVPEKPFKSIMLKRRVRGHLQ